MNDLACYTPNCDRICPVKLTLSKARDLFKDEIVEEIKENDGEPSIHLRYSRRAAQDELYTHINSYFQLGPQPSDGLAP